MNQFEAGGARARADGVIVAVLVALFLASRWLWIVSAPDSIVYFEESYRWVAINEFLHRRFHPWLDYQADHYQGGPLVMMLLTAAAMKLFGQTALVYRMVMAAAGAAVLVLLFGLARRAFGLGAARIAASLYLAGPALVATWSLVQLGSHAESLLFTLPLLAMLLHGARAPRAGSGFVFAAGVLAGLACWFCYSAGFMVAACSGAVVLLVGPPSLRTLATATLGFAAGLVPWLHYNAVYGWRGLDRVWELFGRGSPVDWWTESTWQQRLVRVFTVDLPHGLTLTSGAAGEATAARMVALLTAASVVVAVGYSAACTARVLAARRAARRGSSEPASPAALVHTVVVLYSAAFFAFLGATRFEASGPEAVNFRFYVPWMALVTLSLGDALAQAARRQMAVGVALVLALVVGNASGTVRHARVPVASPPRLASRTGYAVAGLLAYQKYRDQPAAALAASERIDDATTRARFLFGIGWGIGLRIGSPSGGGTLQVLSLVGNTPPAVHTPILQGLLWITANGAKRLTELEGAALARQDAAGRSVHARLFRLRRTAEQTERALEKTPRSIRIIGMGRGQIPGNFPDDEDHFATRAHGATTPSR